ncbi:MAG: response regulator transcription factor [Bacillota bacterium]|jgi:two-component system response regulator MprA|nr:response regulator transcription factor [Bacillota bacterium]
MQPLILVVDDDHKITALLRRSLHHAGYRVREAHGGWEALEAAAAVKPDLVILDLMLPDLDGLEVCRRLRGEGDALILLLTARDEVSDRVRGLDSGADDYLVKPFVLEELLARVRALLRRRCPETDRVLSFSDLSLNPATREVRRGARLLDLTNKEYELLLLFLSNPRRVLSKDEIMEKIWGYDYSGESNVLEVYIGYLRNKLESSGEKRLLYTVRGVGYVLKD